MTTAPEPDEPHTEPLARDVSRLRLTHTNHPQRAAPEQRSIYGSEATPDPGTEVHAPAWARAPRGTPRSGSELALAARTRARTRSLGLVSLPGLELSARARSSGLGLGPARAWAPCLGFEPLLGLGLPARASSPCSSLGLGSLLELGLRLCAWAPCSSSGSCWGCEPLRGLGLPRSGSELLGSAPAATRAPGSYSPALAAISAPASTAPPSSPFASASSRIALSRDAITRTFGSSTIESWSPGTSCTST